MGDGHFVIRHQKLRSIFDPSTLERFCKRIGGVKRRRRDLVDVLIDHRRLEKHRARSDFQDGHFSHRRDFLKPLGRVFEIDEGEREVDFLVFKGNYGALHIRTETEADEFEAICWF